MGSNKNSVCVLESDDLGKVCINKDNFSFSLTNKAIDVIQASLNEMKNKSADKSEQVIIEQRMADLKDPAKSTSILSISSVKLIGEFDLPSKKDQGVMALSIKLDDAKKFGLKSPFIMVALNKNDMKTMMNAVPKSIKTTTDMKIFNDSVKSEINKPLY